MRSWRLTVAGMSAVAVAVAVTATALAPIGSGTIKSVADGKSLSTKHPVLDFSDSISAPVPVPTASDPLPTVCVISCERWMVKVETLEPFLVSIRNNSHSTNDGLNLFVFGPDSKEIGVAGGIGADGQSLTIKPTAKGVYTLVITLTYDFDGVVGYKGEVRIMSGSSWEAPKCPTAKPCPILPALRVDPPSDVKVSGLPPVASTPLGFPLPVNVPTPTSCYIDETTRTGALRCLRFTSEVDDIGQGTLTVRLPWFNTDAGIPTSAFIPGECQAQQMIHYTDGSIRARAAGPCMFHPQHAHFHYKSYVEYALHSVNSNGTTGAIVSKSLKESFCLADDGYFGFGSAGPNGPRNYVGQPGCNIPSLPTPDAWITMGNSPGFGDIYTWDTPDQFIDITKTPPGTYDIVAVANPANRLMLAGNPHPCGATRVQLTKTSVKVLKSGIPCIGDAI